MINFILNDKTISVEVNPAKTLLDFIRDEAGLKGTKEGCREGDCGACTVLAGELIDGTVVYKTINSCLLPIGLISKKHVVTVEGLNSTKLSQVQEEFNNEGASQCGFCTPGFIISLTGYFINELEYSADRAINSIAGNICRCTGYTAIKRAVNNLTESLKPACQNESSRLQSLINQNIIPDYFLSIPDKLSKLTNSDIHEVEKSNFLIGGGTDLFVQKEEEVYSSKVNFVTHKKLNEIRIEKDQCVVGAGVTIEQFKNSEIIKTILPQLESKLELFASLPIRNSATFGGNLVNASPIGDSTIIFLALEAQLKITGDNRSRIVPLNEFYKGYKILDLEAFEIVEEISFDTHSGNTYFNFEKVSKRTYLDIASVNSAINLTIENDTITRASLSAGGIGPIPTWLKKTSAFLTNRVISSDTILKGLDILTSEISPISDIRGSAAYKTLLLQQLFKVHFIELFPEIVDVEVLV